MKPFYFSTKKESNHHPLIEAISWLKAYVKRFIENHNKVYDFEHIVYSLNPDVEDYMTYSHNPPPINDSEIEFRDIYVKWSGLLGQLFNKFKFIFNIDDDITRFCWGDIHRFTFVNNLRSLSVYHCW